MRDSARDDGLTCAMLSLLATRLKSNVVNLREVRFDEAKREFWFVGDFGSRDLRIFAAHHERSGISWSESDELLGSHGKWAQVTARPDSLNREFGCAGSRDRTESTLDGYEHRSATAPMGLENDRAAVVDLQGRVYGVAGLRVVDASIFPDSPSVATNVTTIAVAEHIEGAEEQHRIGLF
jgi:choline dehydrogenase-like flavoprotein